MASPGPGTATGRDPVIDLVRFFCLALVVVGHCMMVSPVLHADGTVTTENTLAEQDWFVPVIWIFMVMPLFFVTGGATGLQSWRRLKAAGGTAAQFVRLRLLRLVRPAMALLAVMFLGLGAAGLMGVHPQVVQLMVAGAAMPLWFLAAYLAAQLNIPLLAACHTRAPWITMAALAALVVAVDCLRGALPALAYANLVFLWCAVQQLGFLAADGCWYRVSRSGLVGIALAANLVLGTVTGLGLYPGNMLVNLNPPTLCLLLLGVSQAAILELSRPALAPLCAVRWVHGLLYRAGVRSLTVYLWHLPLLVGMSGLLLPVVGVFGRLEERPTAVSTSRCRAPAVAAAVVVTFLPVAAAALGGLTLELLGAGAVCFAIAVLVLRGIPGRVSGPAASTSRDPRRRGHPGIASGVK
jgi:fucose 4-O-acetylase-like acetyltransferase